jgi:hypothetical protein
MTALAYRCVMLACAACACAIACGRSDLADHADDGGDSPFGASTNGGHSAEGTSSLAGATGVMSPPSGGSASGAGASVGMGGNTSVDAGSTNGEPDAAWVSPSDPFCPGMSSVEHLDVWGDARGLFVLIGTQSRTLILQNSGAEWHAVLDGAGWELARLSGFPDGPLVIYGPSLCGVRLVEDGSDRCSAAVRGALGFAATGPDRAYATSGSHVFQFDGTLWTQYGARLTATAGDTTYDVHARGVWADAQTLLAGTSIGVFWSEAGGELKLDPDLQHRDYWAVWASTGEQFWAGSADGLRWRSNGSWTRLWSPQPSCRETVKNLWGTGDTVFFATPRTFGVHRGGDQVEILREWPCDGGVSVTGLWGQSETEVYVTAVDLSRRAGCGEAVLFQYDGARLREL